LDLQKKTMIRFVHGTWRQAWPRMPLRCNLERVSHGVLPSANVMLQDFRQHIDVDARVCIHISDIVFEDGLHASWIARGMFDGGDYLHCTFDTGVFVAGAWPNAAWLRTYVNRSYDLEQKYIRARVVYFSERTRVDVDDYGGMVIFNKDEEK